ncbi:MAG: PD-(D/E)XK motif protein [Porticoccaceae bacterium]
MKITAMMSSTSDFFLDDPWKQIKEPCYPYGRRLYLNDERFWVSMDENKQILFFIQEAGADNIKPLENLKSLDVSIEKYGAGEYRLVCRLTSHEPELLEKFSTVAKDIAFHCSAYKGVQLFLKAQERIKSWADFLKPSRTGLTHSEFVGFFGELYVLSEHFMLAIPPDEAVRAWIGPEGKKQDFTFNDSSIEVKTTLSGDQQTIHISSLDQLDKVTRELYLMRVVASPSSDGSGFNLGGLYEKCLQGIGHNVVAEGLFLQKASLLYGKASESQIKDYFVVVNVSIFNVNKNFPKLTRSDIDLAIRDVKYEIAVGALSDFEVADDVEEIIKNG